MAGEIGVRPSIGAGALQTQLADAFDRIGAAIERRLEGERDQLPLWLPVALGVGIALWFVQGDAAAWQATLLAAMAIGAAGFAAKPGSRRGQVLRWSGFLCAAGLALAWGRAELVRAPVLPRPAVVDFSARVEKMERLPARETVRLTLAPDPAAGLPPRLRVNVGEADMPPAAGAGARIRLRARLMPPPPPAVPGAYDFARRAWFDRLGATGRALGKVTLLAPPTPRLATWLAGLRGRLTAHILSRVEGSRGGIAASLVTGDQGAIADADADALRASGLAHLLSISGLHISAAVAGAMLLTLRLLALSPGLALHWPLPLIAAGAGAGAGLAYTLLSGADVPAIRACVAALLVLVGMALGRDALTLRLVAVGALAVLLLWPESLVSASFQLSFAAVTAIVALYEQPRVKALFARREEGAPARMGRLLLSLLLTGLVVETALAPIALFHFHRTGLYGAAANIIAIPLATFVIMPMEALALLLDLAGAGAPLWWLAGNAIGILLQLAHAVAAAPGAVAALPAMPVTAYALLICGGIWLLLWRTGWRLLGLVPVALGASLAITAPVPDLLVTGDGRHLAVRGPQGFLLLRPRAGDYMRETLAGTAGQQGDPGAIDDLPSARCGADLCAAMLFRGGRQWHVLATRSPYLVSIAAMNEACAKADIVMSDRRLPRSCRPRWLKLDRPALARSGGLAINLGSGRVIAVRAGDGHPWAMQAPSSPYPTGGGAPASMMAGQ